MAWDHSGKQFFLTTGGGTVEVFGYEQMLKPGPAESARTLHAHTANCYCIEFAPNGKPKPKPNPNPNPNRQDEIDQLGFEHCLRLGASSSRRSASE